MVLVGYSESTRYPDGDGLNAAGRARREKVRLRAESDKGRRCTDAAPLIVVWDNLNTYKSGPDELEPP